MAEEIPISDVLCNATEYLSKLGSNLRSRSENLKHKRISKDKLKNAHAVRKAASKLLLMCELSKKSLENVENGVKRVLTIVDASRCSPSVGAKTKNVSLDFRSSNKEYFYFEYDSCKLRISKKILLKHYTSLKVHAKSMPVTMLDKYPVYYNCNLYQNRKKTKENEIEDLNVKLKNNSEKNETSSSSSQDTENVNKDLTKNDDDDVSKTPKKGKNITETTHKNDETKSNSENEDGIKTISKDSESKQNETVLKKDNESEKNKIDVIQKTCDVENDMESLVNQIDKPINMDNAKSKKTNHDMECETSSESRYQSESTFEPKLISDKISEESKPAEKKDNELRIKDIAEKSRKSKNVRFLDETSESNLKDSEEGNNRKKRKLEKESECNDTVDLIDDCLKTPKDTERSHELKEKTEQDKDDGSGCNQKPKIKLVSLDKLLKPDVIQKLDGNTDPKVMRQTSIKTYSSKTHKKDGICLLEKRKAVSAFKPKKFSVIVMRLPKFSENFLCKYGLKKIVKDGKIVYKKGCKEVIDCENIDLDVSVNKSQKKSKNSTDDNAKVKKELLEGIAKTRNALLNFDSDSSDTMTKPSTTKLTETAKKDSVSKTKAALLNSDSDSSENINKQKTSKKHSLSRTKVSLVDSDSSSKKNKSKTLKQYFLSRSKTALLESDSDSSGSKNKQETMRKHSLSETKSALLDSDSDNLNGEKDSGTSKKYLSKSKTALLNSDSDNSDKKAEKDSLSKFKTGLVDSDSDSSSQSKQKTIRRHSLSKTQTALFSSDSDNSDTKKKSQTSKKKISNTKTALLISDSDNSNSEGKSKKVEKDSLSKSKSALLNSDSDNSDGKKNSETSKKKVSKTKTALLDSDSDNSDKKADKDSLSKSKTALLDSDSDNSDKKADKDSLSKSKSALLNSDSDNSDSKKNSVTSKKKVSKTKTALLDSDSDNSDKTADKDSLSKSKSALLNSDSDNSDGKKNSETSKKKVSKTKTALLDSDSDNSDKKADKDSLSKSKTALLDSDSDNSDKKAEKDSLSKSKSALLNSDSDNSDSKKNSETSKKKVSKTKTSLLDSDSDNLDKSKTSEKGTLSNSKTALLNSDSDSSSKSKRETKTRDSSSKTKLLDSDSDDSDCKKIIGPLKKKLSTTKTALLDSDSNNSDIKRKSTTSKKDTLTKSKTALLDSDSGNSDSKGKSKTSEKDTLSKSKTALLDSDSSNSDSKGKSKTSEKDTLSKSKTALLDSDSDSSSRSKQETKRKNSSSKTALLNSNSDNSDSKKKSGPSKKKLSNTKTALPDSDSHNSDSKIKSDSKNDSLSEIPISENTIETLSTNLDKYGEEPNKSSDLVKDSPSETGKGNNTDADESNSLKSVEPPETKDSRKDNKDQTTPKSKRKMIMESMQAKKMLLTYSSSSDTDDEQLKNALKDVRNSLLNISSSSGDEIDVKKIVQANRRQLVTPSDSDGSFKKSKLGKKKKKELSKNNEVSSINQFDGTKDEQSDTSSSQMGRSKTKVASSSNQSSENMDSNDIEINRLTDLSSLNRRRRRDSGKKAGPRSTRKMPKAPLIEEEALGAETSDAASDVESDVGEVEDLPAVSLQDLNGDGINHLAKEDLLAQSDSSSSQNDKANGSEEDKKEDSDDDEEDNVKSIRRKPNAISSDSEVGSSRRKVEKVSDFEDSEADSEPRRKTKRKKKGSDSDASLSSNDGSKKKRRRIKQVNDSDGSGSDSENEGKNKHGRKNIRKVMSKDQLEEATKKAARQEKERIARIAERQKLYNNLEFDESGKPDEVVLDKVVLDFDPDTKEPLIEVDRGLVKKLKPHQANGIKFMWNACFESVKRIKKDRGSGCILAHCMGLGKTLQVVSLTHTLLTHGSLTGVRRVLVVCPLSTVLNWVNEFTMWLKHAVNDYEVDVFELSRHKQNSERSWQLQQWVECGGVCVLGYEMFRNLSADNNKKFKKKMLKSFQEALVDPGPDLVVCDEGHLLKNEKTSLSQSMNRVRTLRRIVLTGTPLQNNLKEYYCMVQFVKPNLLGKYNEYLNRFVNPITNGQYTDSTERDISIMKRRSHVLHTMLDGAVQRRDYGVLAPFLPPKLEFVLFITLTDIQIKLYQHYLDNYSRRPLPGKSSGFLFPDFQSLQRIWTHPLVLKYNSERYEIMQQKKRDKEEEDSEGSIADFIDDDSTPEESSTEESSDDLSDASDDSRKKSKKKKSAKKGKGKDSKATGRRGTRANPIEMAEEEKPNSDIEEVKYENPTEWWMKLVTDEELEDIRHSHKLLLLFDILRQCEAIGDKLLVFSQSLYSLDLIEHFLGKVDEATQEARIDEKLAGHVGSWSPGVDYFRLDGSTSCENRSIWCKNFNREDNPRARLFLISTRAGGLGINLVAANRVVIFDVSWNPSHDVQSIFRVYRFGQKKPCYIYRFLAMGTMEEKIYERQVTKQAISKRVIDEQQIDRHYAANDLAELYKFEPEPPEPRPVPSLPKDRLFAEMLKDHEKQIYRFHEHDSLLENKEEETLSEEERKRAWEEFENEKRAPPPAPFPSTWSMHNGMASLLQQQQQQLAYTALAAMIRKDMPNITDNQMRDMLPMICNANPGIFGGYDYGLMQKMSEIYKYAAQPGLMNPSMMNPVMNPASGMSTSSLQYEPPWQRQQQQQQQMRLQQLMQQQQSMGAKYYAGGLGSRDPVAMALQQQRAREFLLGPGAGGGGGGAAPPAAGRPRGRPPLQPRAPAAGDVVNLDSD